jgi:hypothetical protein
MTGIAPLVPAGTRMSKRDYEQWRNDHLWRPSLATGLEIVEDPSAAQWIAVHLHPGSFRVEMMVPDCFESYARIFFPFVGDYIYDDYGRIVDNERVTWSEVAVGNGKVPHALMEAETICAADPGHGHPGALYNSLSEEQESALWPILQRHTTTAQAWFLLWDGFGNVDPRPFERYRKVEHSRRSYHLLHGPLAARDGFANPPSYVWPEDRAWCLTTDIDFYWAFIAATVTCVQEIVATQVLDAYATEPSNPARAGMDLINDPDSIIPRRL